MTTFVQLHLLTAYPPANLNRDDTGQPKTAVFGGSQRLRVSSQALKRAWRTSDAFQQALDGHLAKRTQRLGEEIESHLLGQGIAADAARKAARTVAGLFGKIKPEKDENPTLTEQLVFIAPAERDAALALAERVAAGAAPDPKAADALGQADGAVDIAMFGRMLADDPVFNREAAVQVAHGLTTHRVVIEEDFYTAVDDLKTAATDAGAGFMGEAGFGAGIFYLYLCIDRDLLIKNLGGNEGLARAGIAALVTAAATEGPRGKQASFASRAKASFVLAERGTSGPRSLAQAFLSPVHGDHLLPGSIDALTKTQAAFAKGYGEDNKVETFNVLASQNSLNDIVKFAAA